MDLKLLLGVFPLIIAVISYSLYFRDIYRHHTKPHAFSWLIWGTLAANGFLIQLGAGAGWGALITGATALGCLSISATAFLMKHTYSSHLDRALLLVAFSALAVVLFSDSKLLALGVTLIALIAGYTINTIKAYNNPHEETAITFFLNAVKFLPALFALETFSLLTAAYPITVIFANAVLVTVILARRRQRKAERWTATIEELRVGD